MYLIIIWVLFAYGLCNILIFGSNFNWWRDLLKWFGTGPYSLYKLFTCFMCLPTWVGFFMSYVTKTYLNCYNPSYSYGIDHFWVGVFVDGIITSGAVWLVHTLQEKMEK